MNIGGGEAADQMVRMLLSGTEVVIRLSGSALKNLLALTLALALWLSLINISETTRH